MLQAHCGYAVTVTLAAVMYNSLRLAFRSLFISSSRRAWNEAVKYATKSYLYYFSNMLQI